MMISVPMIAVTEVLPAVVAVLVKTNERCRYWAPRVHALFHLNLASNMVGALLGGAEWFNLSPDTFVLTRLR